MVEFRMQGQTISEMIISVKPLNIVANATLSEVLYGDRVDSIFGKKAFIFLLTTLENKKPYRSSTKSAHDCIFHY